MPDIDNVNPWPPTVMLEQLSVTRGEWEDMKASTLPKALAITIMFKKATRRLMNERAKPRTHRTQA